MQAKQWSEAELQIASIYLLHGFLSGEVKGRDNFVKAMNVIMDYFKNNEYLYNNRIYIVFAMIAKLTNGRFITEINSIIEIKHYDGDEIEKLTKIVNDLAEDIKDMLR